MKPRSLLFAITVSVTATTLAAACLGWFSPRAAHARTPDAGRQARARDALADGPDWHWRHCQPTHWRACLLQQ